MITNQQVEGLMTGSGNVLGPNGDRIGSVGTFYLDDQTDEPAWVTVNTGLFGTSETFIPLSEATVEGVDVLVPYSKEEVKNAPQIESDGSISPEEEVTLYRYYGFSYDDGSTESFSETDTITTDSGTSGMRDADAGLVSDERTAGTSTGSGTSNLSDHSRSGANIDDAMTRSEERLNVGTENRAVGKARLRKYIVTETVTQQVPVSHEEVRIEREPITDANAGDALSGAELTEDEHEVTLHAEEPVVSKHTEPVERVRLDTETVTDTESVSEEVRKEQIDTDVNDSDIRRGKSGGSGSGGSGSGGSGSGGSSGSGSGSGRGR
ncbi:YsnF/AvaK domain-containing protein [Arthrobacter sp. zg-Y20]|uniref:YsnF/AvaK domain-containing protein n=1 Tax=unclassified Arthrobacter TaxID=235627 RepID=UPI001D145408|nr:MULTISPECIES: YsnF/AvaK domain-containing protein [unclassified Arthrobacter]MCC3275240.1 YsnF/AvaK domain-containing protein [Arthrobacter sp. zg-Y20]MDK1315397.1 YsnF/AvaK domain-containing protein [Arthrobacter sp. zg.Y20]MDK1326610.1 YsnF/AvaK domain-containing protein [Arthrobacter sp. zg-Y1143]WIB05814.1 YsnF/AvaK domain-containing protein [Arthrobacter sp. zg-Y20]